jgi:predicted RNA-binding protein (virulence factor B family)
MALVGRYNSLQVVKHTNFGLYLDGGADGEILLPNRYIPKDIPSEDEDWLNVFLFIWTAMTNSSQLLKNRKFRSVNSPV